MVAFTNNTGSSFGPFTPGTPGAQSFFSRGGAGANTPWVPGAVAKAVRGFTPAELLLQRLVKQRPADGELATAEAVWGKPSNFQVADITSGGMTENTVVTWPDTQGTFVVPVTTLQFQEVDREEETIRIENPDDSEQWVEVKRIKTITFKGPDLRPKETLTGTTVYPQTLAGSLARIADSFARAVGGELTDLGAPNATRPPYAFYKLTLKNE